MNPSSLRVLIAEDEFFVAETIQEKLEEAGYRVAGRAMDGREALDLTRQLRPDVVLMDINMPEMDGIEAAQKIQEQCPTPVVVLTSYDDKELVLNATETGIGAFLVKPPERGDLDRALIIATARFQDLQNLKKANAQLKTEMERRKQLEEERRQLSERIQLARKIESLGIMAGGVAHDFNNLLTTIIGNLSLAMGDLSEEEENYESLQDALEAARNASNLSRAMLSYSGHGKFLNRPIDVKKILENTRSYLLKRLPPHTELHWEIEEKAGQMLGDQNLLEQALVHVALNAAEALETLPPTPEKPGYIQLSAQTINDPVQDRRFLFVDDHFSGPPYFQIEVKDNGPGIPQSHQEKVSDPFFTTRFQGRGLGLSVTLGIVRSHHGALSLESEEGAGCTVQILLPLQGK